MRSTLVDGDPSATTIAVPRRRLAAATVASDGRCPVALLDHALNVVRVWRRRSRYRRELARLLRSSPHMIADIGLSRAQAQREVASPFWRP